MSRTTQSALAGALVLLAAGAAEAWVSQRAGVNPLHWAEQTLTFTIAAGADPAIDDGSDLLAARQAFAAWEAVPGARVAFREDADPAARARTDWRADDVHMVVWDTDGSSGLFDAASGLVAATPLDFDPTTGEITDADVILDASRHRFATDGDPNAFDLQAVLTHEVGHFLGLDHSAVEGATMSPIVQRGDTRPRTLEADDRAAAATLYPGGAALGALRGRVLRDGQPVSGAHVVAEDARGVAAAATLSGADGAFEIAGLEGGAYVVYAEPLDGRVTAAHFQLAASRLRVDTDFGATFWGRAGRSSPAAPETADVTYGRATDLGALDVLPAHDLRLRTLSQEVLRPGTAARVTIFGSGIAQADSVVVTGPPGDDLRVSDPSFFGRSLRVTLDPPGWAEPQLRSIRVFSRDTWACAVLTGRLELQAPPPVIDGVSTRAVAPGDPLTITGADFAPGARVHLGPFAVPAVGSGGRLDLTLPALPDGTWDVVVANPDGQLALAANALEVSGSSAPPVDETPPSGDAAPAAGGGPADPTAHLPPPGGGGGGGGCSLGAEPQDPAGGAFLLLGLAALLLLRRRVDS